MQDTYRVYTDYFQAACAHYQAGFEQIAKCGRSIAEDTIDVLQSDANSAVRKRHSPSSRPLPREREYRAAGGSRGGLGRKFGVGTGEQKQSHRLGASLKHQRTHCEFLRLW